MSINDTERGNLIQKNENSSQKITLNDNTENDTFFFVFTPSKIDIDFLCGCSLHCGVRLIAIIFLIGSIIGILSSMATQVVFDNIIAFIVSFFGEFVDSTYIIALHNKKFNNKLHLIPTKNRFNPRMVKNRHATVRHP